MKHFEVKLSLGEASYKEFPGLDVVEVFKWDNDLDDHDMLDFCRVGEAIDLASVQYCLESGHNLFTIQINDKLYVHRYSYYIKEENILSRFYTVKDKRMTKAEAIKEYNFYMDVCIKNKPNKQNIIKAKVYSLE